LQLIRSVVQAVVVEIELVVRLWLGHLILALVFVVPLVWFSRNRVQWKWWEGLAFVGPFAVWMLLPYLVSREKSISNLVEAFLISVTLVAGATLRVVIGRRGSPFVPVAIQCCVVAVAIAIYILVPWLPE